MIHLPMLDTSRARVELGRQPRYDATDALREVLAGFAAGSGGTTAPLRWMPVAAAVTRIRLGYRRQRIDRGTHRPRSAIRDRGA